MQLITINFLRTWKMVAPNVVKMFMWRAYNNALPTKANLLGRKIVVGSLYLICGLEAETKGIDYRIVWGQKIHGVYMVGTRKLQKSRKEGDEFIYILWGRSQ